MWEEDEEDYGALFEPSLSYRQRRREKRIRKIMERQERPEPQIKDFLLMRATELLLPEIVVSVILSVLIVWGAVPSTVFAASIIMGVSLIGYIVYVLITSIQLFWVLGDAKKYAVVNLGAYAVFMVLSIVVRAIDIKVFSWMFLPAKLMTLFGMSAWLSLFMVHAVIVAIMLIMLLNVRSHAYSEMKNMDIDE